MPNKKGVIFMEAPPKQGAAAAVKMPGTRPGAAGDLQDVLNDSIWKIKRARPTDPKKRRARISFTITEPPSE